MSYKDIKFTKGKKFLVTGVAGFIGFHLTKKLLDLDCTVIGIDNLNDYYDVNLKKARLNNIKEYSNFKFELGSLEDERFIMKVFETYDIDIVVNLAAQAGVRYSIENPRAYIDSNIVGFLNIIEACRYKEIEHLVYASSSSVYGSNTSLPFSTNDSVDHPISLYAATKKADELIAHTYSHLYGIPTTGLRFFTVYGPWGRPDMALFLFTDAIVKGNPIKVFNHGDMERDFTYIDDIVEGIIRVTKNPPVPNENYDFNKPIPGRSSAPYRIYNIGNNKPVKLMKYIEEIEKNLGKTAVKVMLPLQPGDVPKTYANVDDLVRDVEFKPNTSIEDGVKQFVNWYVDYYGAS